MDSQVHYLPLTPGFFSILLVLLAGLIILIQLRILRYAYMKLGVGPGAAMFLLFGTLIGADLLNLDKITNLGAPVASIGGAGTFDGIFLTGILAVLLAAIATPSRPRPAW